VVLDGVGGEIGEEAFEVTAPRGRFSAHGAPSGGFTQIDTRGSHERNIIVRGIEDVQFARPGDLPSGALSKAAAGEIGPVIGQVLPLDRVAQAHAAIASRDVIGKTLLVI